MARKKTLADFDEGQFELMWNFLRMGQQKANIPALKGLCDQLRQCLLQKTAGQRADDPDDYINFSNVGTIINCIAIEAMALYLSGDLDKLEEMHNEQDVL